MKTVLAVVAHPDDEVLGVGGTLARHVLEGHYVTLVVLCENMSLRLQSFDTGCALLKSAKVLGLQEVTHLKLKDQHLDQEPFIDLVTHVENYVAECQPDFVYTHWAGDLNRDHRITAEAVHVATRPKYGRPTKLLEFYTPSSTEYTTPLNFVPDTWVNITEVLPEKEAALACYESEIQPYELPRNTHGVHTVGRFYGMQVGVPFAEVFRTARCLI